MESKILVRPPVRDGESKPSLDRDEQFKKKMAELDAKLSEITALFSGQTVIVPKKCSFCGDETSGKTGGCPFCKSHVGAGHVTKKQEADEPQEKILYTIRGNGRNAMGWHKIANTEAARAAVEEKFGYGFTIEEAIVVLARKGWAVSHADENVITFSRKESSFNSLTFFLLLCLFVVPGLIYAVAVRAPKTVHVTFPLK